MVNRPNQLTEKQAKDVSFILIGECGWRPGEREVREFLRYVMEPSIHPKEFRFFGDLGGGGKFHATTSTIGLGPWYVSCYPEERTDKRSEMIFKANDLLRMLWESHSKEDAS